MKRGYTLRKINWVIPGGRSKRMFLMLGCVSWVLMLLCSCGRNLPDSEQVIKRYLKEKYNQMMLFHLRFMKMEESQIIIPR